MFQCVWGVGERKHWLGAARWGIAVCAQRAAAHRACFYAEFFFLHWEFLRVSDPPVRQLVSANTIDFIVFMKYFIRRTARGTGVFVLTGWQLPRGAEFVVVLTRMLSAAAPAGGWQASSARLLLLYKINQYLYICSLWAGFNKGILEGWRFLQYSFVSANHEASHTLDDLYKQPTFEVLEHWYFMVPSI